MKSGKLEVVMKSGKLAVGGTVLAVVLVYFCHPRGCDSQEPAQDAVKATPFESGERDVSEPTLRARVTELSPWLLPAFDAGLDPALARSVVLTFGDLIEPGLLTGLGTKLAQWNRDEREQVLDLLVREPFLVAAAANGGLECLTLIDQEPTVSAYVMLGASFVPTSPHEAAATAERTPRELCSSVLNAIAECPEPWQESATFLEPQDRLAFILNLTDESPVDAECPKGIMPPEARAIATSAPLGRYWRENPDRLHQLTLSMAVGETDPLDALLALGVVLPVRAASDVPHKVFDSALLEFPEATISALALDGMTQEDANRALRLADEHGNRVFPLLVAAESPEELAEFLGDLERDGKHYLDTFVVDADGSVRVNWTKQLMRVIPGFDVWEKTGAGAPITGWDVTWVAIDSVALLTVVLSGGASLSGAAAGKAASTAKQGRRLKKLLEVAEHLKDRARTKLVTLVARSTPPSTVLHAFRGVRDKAPVFRTLADLEGIVRTGLVAWRTRALSHDATLVTRVASAGDVGSEVGALARFAGRCLRDETFGAKVRVFAARTRKPGVVIRIVDGSHSIVQRFMGRKAADAALDFVGGLPGLRQVHQKIMGGIAEEGFDALLQVSGGIFREIGMRSVHSKLTEGGAITYYFFSDADR